MMFPSTETANEASAGLDLLGTPALVELLVKEQRFAVVAVLAQIEEIAGAVDEIAARLRTGGALHYVGAGSSGRLAMLDAAEMSPTFGTPAEMVQAHIAGGAVALLRAVEGAEDDADAGAAAAEEVGSNDAVVGISASGGASFVIEAIRASRKRGAYTVALTCVEQSELAGAAHDAIVLDTGAEILTGSTRMKAGTAQKIALNAISTAVMVRLGKVYDNLMVDVVAGNKKLRARALGLVQKLAQVDDARARELLDSANGRVKVAVVMQRQNVDATQAKILLERHDGALRPLL
jgi:N-acetylmuramic acid 6-phosphate etherase